MIDFKEEIGLKLIRKTLYLTEPFYDADNPDPQTRRIFGPGNWSQRISHSCDFSRPRMKFWSVRGVEEIYELWKCGSFISKQGQFWGRS